MKDREQLADDGDEGGGSAQRVLERRVSTGIISLPVLSEILSAVGPWPALRYSGEVIGSTRPRSGRDTGELTE